MNKYMNSTNNLSVMRSDFKEKFPLEKKYVIDVEI